MDIGSWTLEFSSGIPVYRQIVNLVMGEIGSGGLDKGDRLPTIREVMEALNVNPNTVAKAYRELDLRGIIWSRRGAGSYVSGQLPAPAGLTPGQRSEKLNELFDRVIAEAASVGINRRELLEYVTERISDHG